MTQPTFLFIGPDKTGSSWIYEYLDAHPQCFVPEAKDLYFFDREYARGLKWYEKFFAPATPEQTAVGELSHDYILSDEVADRIRRDFAGIKLVSVIRNPIDRTYSHYLYLRRSGLTQGSFQEALQAFPELIENSRYSVMLQRYRDRFPDEQLCFLMFDDLRRRPQVFANQLTDFLGIERMDAENIGVVRPASRARSYHLARLMKIGAAAARKLGLQNLVGRLKHGALGQSLYVPIDKSERERLSAEDRAILEERFAEEFLWIEGFTGVDMSAPAAASVQAGPAPQEMAAEPEEVKAR